MTAPAITTGAVRTEAIPAKTVPAPANNALPAVAAMPPAALATPPRPNMLPRPVKPDNANAPLPRNFVAPHNPRPPILVKYLALFQAPVGIGARAGLGTPGALGPPGPPMTLMSLLPSSEPSGFCFLPRNLSYMLFNPPPIPPSKELLGPNWRGPAAFGLLGSMTWLSSRLRRIMSS